MKARFFVRMLTVVALPMALTACGVPDLIAHGVKSYESSQSKSQQQDYAQQVQPQPKVQPARYDPEPPPIAAESVPPRESVAVESLR